MNTNNILLNVDSYKASHYLQYPPKTEYVYSYIESRGGKYPNTVFFGLQMFLKEYLSKPITQEMIDEAEMFWKVHGEPFNKEGWEYILKEHLGFLPIKIKAVPEGSVIPVHNVLATIENTDPKCYWLTSYIETSMLRAVWYPTTVATNSWSIKQTIKKYLKETADDLSGLPFCLHDFAGRGVSSFESAGLGGVAHLVNFMGTDTVTGALYAMKYYNAEMPPAYSVPAAEHSSITTWGREGELDAYRNMLKQFGGDYPIISVVSDSYDIFTAVEQMWGKELKYEVLTSGSKLVVRPDSSVGHPSEVVLQVVQLLDKTFGSTINTKGFIELNPAVGVIQGDGVDQESINRILYVLTDAGYSANNVVFGSGGALLQKVNRDTCKFAYKASWALIDGKEVDVYKDPITDPGKRSKKGRLDLYKNINNSYFTSKEGLPGGLLQTVFENGELTKGYSFDEVRENSNI